MDLAGTGNEISVPTGKRRLSTKGMRICKDAATVGVIKSAQSRETMGLMIQLYTALEALPMSPTIPTDIRPHVPIKIRQ
jgi:hypothetical protein